MLNHLKHHFIGMTFDVLIINTLLTITGLYIAGYIYHHKKHLKAMICAPHHGCDKVIHSSFSRLLNIDNSLLGMIYYGSMLAAIIILFLFNNILPPQSSAVLLMIAILAAVYSWVLVGIMIFNLKNKCLWCLGSWVVSNILVLTLWCNYVTYR